jgi:hypothetical protein
MVEGSSEGKSRKFISGKQILAAWFIFGGAFWTTRLITHYNALRLYLTYWSFGLELAILVQIGICDYCVTNKKCEGLNWERAVVSLIGVFLGTAAMVFVGSVYISVDAAAELGTMLVADSTLPLSNLWTHTFPFLIGIVLVFTYKDELNTHLVGSRWITWIWPFSNVSIEDKKTGLHTQQKYTRASRAFDVVHFWGAGLVPGIWILTCDPEEVYNIHTSVAIYLFGFAALFAPSIVISFVALVNNLGGETLRLRFSRSRQLLALLAKRHHYV